MDLQKQVTLISRDLNGSPEAKPSVNTQLSLFEAVRRWAEDEGSSSLTIDDAGKPLTRTDILEITKSQIYKDMVLAFDDRR